MYWKFWQPKHTVASVAKEIAAGLRDGSIALEQPAPVLEVEFFVDPKLSEAEVRTITQKLALQIDELSRSVGGSGLAVRAVTIDRTQPASPSNDAAAARQTAATTGT